MYQLIFWPKKTASFCGWRWAFLPPVFILSIPFLNTSSRDFNLHNTVVSTASICYPTSKMIRRVSSTPMATRIHASSTPVSSRQVQVQRNFHLRPFFVLPPRAVLKSGPELPVIVLRQRQSNRSNLLQSQQSQRSFSSGTCQHLVSYLCVHVFVSVKPGSENDFLAATLANARASSKEPGIARFDVIQQEDDPTKFVLVEVYKSADAPAAHRETEHYLTWRKTVEDMMAEPRKAIKFRNLFPHTAGGWDYGDGICLE